MTRSLVAAAACGASLLFAAACATPGGITRTDSRIDSLRTANVALEMERSRLADSLAAIDYVVSGDADRDIWRLKNENAKLTYDLQSCREGGEVMARLLVDELFEPASARLTLAGREQINTVIGGFLTDDLRHVVVVGHADDSKPGPALARQYPTNWELSAARATAVVRHILDVTSFDPAAISAVSHGDAHPEYSNATPNGRKMNRRIEILRR